MMIGFDISYKFVFEYLRPNFGYLVICWLDEWVQLFAFHEKRDHEKFP
jgi:hypothetical protein